LFQPLVDPGRIARRHEGDGDLDGGRYFPGLGGLRAGAGAESLGNAQKAACGLRWGVSKGFQAGVVGKHGVPFGEPAGRGGAVAFGKDRPLPPKGGLCRIEFSEIVRTATVLTIHGFAGKLPTARP
jgi:hypothetical protein